MILLSSLALLTLAAPQQGPISAQGVPTQSSLGGAYVSPFTPPLQAGVVGGRMVQVTLNLPGHTWQEEFIVGIPRPMQVPAPVLTLFHGYGEEPQHVVQNTSLVADAMSRGWIVFIPLGAHKYNYGIDYAQENIEAAFAFFGTRLPIDRDRIYGVGFSMGGGAAASYAARHLDPNGIQFAALVNHTGTASLRATYHTSNDTLLFRSPLMFGDTPELAPFRYMRSSTVDLDPFTGLVDASNTLAPNLSTIPTRHWYASMDANQTIVDQTRALDQFMRQTGGDSDEVVVASSVHTWSTLDEVAVLDWLESQTLRAPAPGDVTKTIADRDGRWHDLEITQAAPNAFTPILWSARPGRNALYLIEMENVASVGTSVPGIGLDAQQPLTLVVQKVDASSPDLVLEGYPSAPSAVSRGGAATPAWTHDPVAGTVTLHETAQAGWSVWTVAP